MGDQPDTQRQIGDLVRLATVASVDHGAATCRVRVGDILTGDLPWLTLRAGATRHWSPPSVGEQVVLLCPESDTAAGIVLPGIYSDANAAPSADEHATVVTYADGAVLTYDASAHALTATLPAGGTATIEASGGITLRADVTIEGRLTVRDDVTGSGVSLKNHVHDHVQAGGAVSGKPVA
ncbi:phage baseplate assembly protein V [Sphingomonas oligophenolica]|uniref:Phage baseplate assembly protein V n=1 Tax=Sphingomonas oligophenolica TaxID=301154 RepID=A0A502CNP6_9SPHN|nr:phage baseplate assembly protein V [Sphingomonas oligophenolica]TPG14372.1 phage baseplate assembly protein V [Sphingomonas oligophenolica]